MGNQSTFAIAAAAFATAAAGFGHGTPDARPRVYLDLIEAAVAAYSDEHLARYVAETERDGVREHGFPRLAANLGILLANGRVPERRETFQRMMSLCCRDAAKGKMPLASSGNEFTVKELVAALVAVERAGLFPPGVTDVWRADLSRVEAARCYSCLPPVGWNKAHNWCVFGSASEQARLAAGVGGDPAHVERYVADQLRWFDANGMYRDPNQPAVYDFVTRLQFMSLLQDGYDGPSRARLEELLDRAAEPTLAMLSAAGEIPYGGRSNQFLHNHTFYAAVCEWYAARAARRGDAESAARFRAAAQEAVAALRPWLDQHPVRHVKNLYPTDSGLGCERYAYFDKYMVTMGSWAAMALRFAIGKADISHLEFVDNQQPHCPQPFANGNCSQMANAPSVFATTPDFHFLFLRAGDYSAQFDWNADPHYDCDGLGRLHRRGAPAALCLSTPCAAHPTYATERPNDCALAIVPAGCDAIVPAGHGADAVSAWADWTAGGIDWRCRLSADGLETTLSGPGSVALRLPAFVFDGENATEILHDDHSLAIRHQGWECRYETDGAIVDTGLVSCNRNGRYRVFEARGENRIRVRIVLLPIGHAGLPVCLTHVASHR